MVLSVVIDSRDQ